MATFIGRLLKSCRNFARAIIKMASCVALCPAATPGFANDLRTLPRIETRAPNICSSVSPAGSFAPAGSNYKPKYHTIAHRFLDEEIGAGGVTQDMYAILDAVIDESVLTLTPYKTLTNLLSRKWIARTGRIDEFGPELYSIRPEGLLAIEFDTCAVASGFSRPRWKDRPAGASAYKDLPAKLEEFKNSK